MTRNIQLQISQSTYIFRVKNGLSFNFVQYSTQMNNRIIMNVLKTIYQQCIHYNNIQHFYSIDTSIFKRYFVILTVIKILIEHVYNFDKNSFISWFILVFIVLNQAVCSFRLATEFETYNEVHFYTF